MRKNLPALRDWRQNKKISADKIKNQWRLLPLEVIYKLFFQAGQGMRTLGLSFCIYEMGILGSQVTPEVP